MLNPLEPPDGHHLDAAQGWLELGNPVEAEVELGKIARRYRVHPEVLRVQYEVHARSRRWEDCVEAAQTLIKAAPGDPQGVILRSYALHELKRTQAAWDFLLPTAEIFPRTSTIAYNLACYAAQLGRLEEARQWLKRAMQVGNAKHIKLMALDDQDLAPLWQELGP